MRGGGAPQGTAVDVHAMAIDLRTRDKRVVREIGGLVHARFGRSAPACSIARIVDDEQGGTGWPEIANGGPNRGNRFAIAVEPQQAGRFYRPSPPLAALRRRRQIPSGELRPILHLQLNLLTVSDRAYGIRESGPRCREGDFFF